MDNFFDIGSYYSANYERLFHYANKILASEEEARDVVSDTFLKIMTQNFTLDVNRNIPSLIVTALRNRCLDILRHRRHKDGYEQQMSKFETAAVYDVDNETDRNELYALVNMRLSRMPDRERSMFEQIKIEGKSYREVADSMAISVRSVEYRLNKTVRDLRCHLEQMYA
jgi:RNA polymerase sigma-70 factor (ECF subfamily)